MRAGSVIRAEWPSGLSKISDVAEAAFAGAKHTGGNETAIVDALRTAGDLTLSLVATDAVRIVGHVAFSAVQIADETIAWYGLGPVAVLPEVQGLGIGSRLIRHGLEQLKASGAGGVVVSGDPGYYRRFGFKPDPSLVFPGGPAIYFQALALTGEAPQGVVRYAPVFG